MNNNYIKILFFEEAIPQKYEKFMKKVSNYYCLTAFWG